MNETLAYINRLRERRGAAPVPEPEPRPPKHEAPYEGSVFSPVEAAWAPETTVLVYYTRDGLSRSRGWYCDNCRQIGVLHSERCPRCLSEFVATTSPFGEEREYIERVRPDLPYVHTRWG